MNIYIGNLGQDVTENDIRDAFAAFGQVISAVIIKEKFGGQSRGFGFVEMPARKEAEAAMEGIKTLKGRMVIVNESRSRSFGSRSAGRGGLRQRGRYARERRY